LFEGKCIAECKDVYNLSLENMESYFINIDGIDYNRIDYVGDYLKIKKSYSYFNFGVLVFDIQQSLEVETLVPLPLFMK